MVAIALRSIIFVFSFLAAICVPEAFASEITIIPSPIPTGAIDPFFSASVLSGNGSVVAGGIKYWNGPDSNDPGGHAGLFRWTKNDGFMFFFETGEPPLPVFFSCGAAGLSYDGSVVAWWTHEYDYYNDSYRFTLDHGVDFFENIYDESDEVEFASDMSADGSVVVGVNGICGDGCREIFIWKESTGKVPISFPDLNVRVEYPVVSGDGKKIAVSTAYDDIYLWTELNGFQWLGFGKVADISTSGSVIVGTAPNGRAFRYTSTNGMEEIGDFSPVKTNHDGSMIIGESYFWSEANGLQSIRDYFISKGIDLDSEGWIIDSAKNISDDGGVILGTGYREGVMNWWIATLDIVAVDNTDAQFSKAGRWKGSNKAVGFYGPNYVYANAGDGASVATFTFQIPSNGNYEISALWPAHDSRASNAPYRLFNNGSLVDIIRVNQRLNGGRFNLLTGPASAGAGVYALSAGVLEVTVDNDADGKVAADSVRVAKLEDPGIVDNVDEQFSKVGNWSVSNKAAGYFGPDYAYALSGDGSSVATFTFQIHHTGNYEIAAQWPAHYSRASNAPYRLFNNGSLLDTIRVDQRLNGGKFNLLTGLDAAGPGIYMLNAGVLQVSIGNNADGKVAADAVRVVSMDQ